MRPRPHLWRLGLPAVAFLWLMAGLLVAPRIEADLRRALADLPAFAPGGALERLGVRPEIDGRDAVLVAELGLSVDVRTEAEMRLAAIAGLRTVRTEETAAIALSPFRLDIGRDRDRLTLRGGVPSSDVRAAVMETAGRIVSADSVDARLRLASGAPPAFAAGARVLLELVSLLPEAQASLIDGTVTLRGEAPDAASYVAARAALARLPDGIVPGFVEIRPPFARPFTWSIIRDGRRLAIGGHVPSERSREGLLAVASRLPGIALVEDTTVTARGLDPAVEFAALASAGLAALADLEAGTFALAGRTVSVSGSTVVRTAAAAIPAALRRSLPPMLDVGPVTVRTVPASPFVFSARRDGDRLVLSGHVPSGTERRAATDLAAARFVGDRIVDETKEADGAPPAFAEALRIALGGLADLANGEAVLADASLRLSGTSLLPQAAERARGRIPRAVPPGWTTEVAIAAATVGPSLEPSQCADLLADLSRDKPLAFATGQAEPDPGSLAALRDIVRRCGRARITVVHRPAGEPVPGLAARRAEAVARALTGRAGLAQVVAGEAPAGAVPPPRDLTEFLVGA